MSELYRVGQEDGRLIYRGDKLFATVFDFADAAGTVAALNGESAEPVEVTGPETFRGGTWTENAR